MNDAFYDYENKVARGETLTIAGRDARWTKIKNLAVGARIAIPQDKTLDRFTNTRHSGLSRIDSGVAAPQNDGRNSVLFDEIVEIKSVGREHVYDIEVEGTHNFVGGHLVNRLTKAVIPSAVEESLAHASDADTRSEILRQAGLAQDDIEYGGVFAHNTYVSGNLGVGSSSTVNKFEVSGAAVVGSGYAQIATAPADGLLVQGNVGIGTTNPAATLEVNGTLKVDSLTTGGSALYINGGILSSSDATLKNNITGFGSVLDKINALTPVDYNWKKSGMSDTGFIAQDVQRIFPELVGDMGNGTLGVYYSKFTPYLVKGIQELNSMVLSQGVMLSAAEASLANASQLKLPASAGDSSTTLGMTIQGIRDELNVGIGSTSPIAQRFAGLDIKLAENGQILGQQGEKLNTVDAAIQALQKQVTALQAVILSGASPQAGGANGSLANASNGPASAGDSSPASGRTQNDGGTGGMSLNSILVTASGTIPADLDYGMGEEASLSLSASPITSNQLPITNEATPSAVLGEATASATPEASSSAVILGTEGTPGSAPDSGVVAGLLPRMTGEGTPSAGLAMTEASPSSSVIPTPSSVILSGAKDLGATSSASYASLDSSSSTQNDISKDVSLNNVGSLTITAGLRVFGQTLLGPTNIAGITTVGNIVIDEDSLDAFGILRIQTLARGLIELMAGQITIDTSGDIILHSGNLVIETGQIYGNASLRGAATLDVDSTFAVVPQSWAKAPKSVILTPDYNTKAWVENLGANGFIVRVDPAPTTSQKVYWIAVW